MNCAKCNKPLAANATKCAACGAVTLKAPVGGSDDIDLMPMEPSKAPAQSEFEPPPEIFQGPPPPPPTKKAEKVAWDPSQPLPSESEKKIRGAMAGPPKSKLPLMIGAGLGVLVLIYAGYLMFRTVNKIEGKNNLNQTVNLQPNQARVENYTVTGKVSYTFEVNSLDGDVLVGVVQRSPRDPATIAALKKLPDPLDTVHKGETRPISGELKEGTHSWVLINEGKKVARVKMKFSAKE